MKSREFKFRVWLNCPDCRTEIDQPHVSGCDIERCSICKGQWISCGHKTHNPKEERWMGIWPGEAEAVARGWFVRWIPTKEGPYGQWEIVDGEHPEAKPDLNSLMQFKMGLGSPSR